MGAGGQPWGGRLRSRRAGGGRGAGTAPGGTRALVVVAEEAGPAVEACRRRFDPSAAAGMPPHVTVLYPLPRYDRAVGEALSAVLVGHPPFRYELVALGRFPHVVYLEPEPPGPFVRLTEAASACLAAFPYGGRFDRVVPHVTVAMRRRLPRSVRRSLTGALPIACEARSVHVLADVAGRWTVVDSLPLGRPPSPGG